MGSKKNDSYSLFISLINSPEINASGYLKGNIALSLLKKALSKNEIHELKYFWDNIESVAGRFDDIDKDLKIALKKAAYFHIQEINNLVRLKNFNLPNIFLCIAKCIINFGWILRMKVNKTFGQITIIFGRKLYSFVIRLRRKYLELLMFTRYFEAPIIYFSWKYNKFNPGELVRNYIQQIPIDHRIGPVYGCIKNKFVSNALFGIDFLPSNGNLHFLESNVNPGHSIGRHYAFPNGDPLCHNLCLYAIRLKLTKIILYPYRGGAVFPIELEKEWKKIAKHYNIRIEIIDDPYAGSPFKRKSYFCIPNIGHNTLFVNGRWVLGPLTTLIDVKGLLDSEIEIYNREKKNFNRVYISKRINDQSDIPNFIKSNVFPNIIMKNIFGARAEGIKLFKLDKVQQFNDSNTIAYEYLERDLIIKKDNGEDKKYAYDFRTYLLITPSGPVYLGAKKIVNTIPIPSKIINGELKDITPYVFNTLKTAKNVRTSEEEDIKCKQATLSVGNVIYDFLRKKYTLSVN